MSTMSFTLGTVIAETLEKTKTRPESLRTPAGAMRPAMHGQTKALGLHSCRALSSRLQFQLTKETEKNKISITSR